LIKNINNLSVDASTEARLIANFNFSKS